MRAVRIAGGVIIALVLVLIAGISATIGWRPFLGPKARPLTNRRFDRTPDRLTRGKYLVEDVVGCFDCHGDHDWTKHDAPLIEGTRGVAPLEFMLKGLPGRVVPSNISSDPETGAGAWSDDQLARAIREGIGHDGRALFPFMSYPDYRYMSDEDLAAVVVYLRSLPPVRKELPSTEINFPVKYLMRSAPQPVESVAPPDLSSPIKRGEYLVTVSGCADCHTPQRRGQHIPGLEFAGGFVLEGSWGYCASANITPDASGISYYDETLFLQAMGTGFVKARQLNQIMPWWHYRNMTDEDLKAIFAYVRTFKPVRHRVDNAEPPTDCRLCGFKHGAGNQN